MEMSQGNSLCSYLKQTKIPFFFFYKIREQNRSSLRELAPVERGRQWEKGMGR
jgi:hypothetical protein